MGKISTQNKAHIGAIAKLGVFASFLLVTAFSIWFYSPVIKTHADESATAEVNVDVQPVISLNLSADELNFSLKPKSLTVSASDKKSVIATVKTNNSLGYQLYFSSEDNNTSMTSTANPGYAIESLTERYSNLDVPSDKNAVWGYSVTGNTASWNPIPPLSSPKAIKYTSGPRITDNDTTLYIGIAAKTGIAAGTYSKNVTFSAITNSAVPNQTLASISNMQQMTPSICESASTGETATLTDSRDGEDYTVMKLGDDECWMMKDLHFVGPYTLTSADSDVETDFELPAVTSYSTTYDAAVLKNFDYPVADEGAAYNYYAASAGTIATSNNKIDATHSICPKGWQLPSQSQITSFLLSNDITDDANGVAIISSAPYNFSFYRWLYNVSNSNANDVAQRNYSFYWTSSNYGTNGIYRSILRSARGESDTHVHIYLHGRSNLALVRCVARH